MSTIKASLRKAQVVGTLSEINMEIQEKEITIDGKKIKCEAVVKKEFKNPSLTIEVNGNPIGIDFINTYEIDKDGKHNKNFDGMKKILGTYVPKMKETEDNPATRVKADGMLSLNEYANDQGEFKSFPGILCFNPCTSHKVPEEDMAEIIVNGFLAKKHVETKGEDAEETGRLLITMVTFDNEGKALPFNFIVPEDLAEDFDYVYEVGASCEIGVEIITKQVGAKKKNSNKAFGRDTKIVSGFPVTEYQVFTGEIPYEEDSEYYVDSKTVKEAMNERKLMIEATIADKKDKSKESKPAKKSLGARKAKVAPESPIDDDMDTIDDIF